MTDKHNQETANEDKKETASDNDDEEEEMTILERMQKAIHEAHKQNDLDGGSGGAHPRTVAKYMGVSETMARDHLLTYAENTDKIKEVNGWSPSSTRVRKSYITSELYDELDYGVNKPEPVSPAQNIP